jgi:hypothetical protein
MAYYHPIRIASNRVTELNQFLFDELNQARNLAFQIKWRIPQVRGVASGTVMVFDIDDSFRAELDQRLDTYEREITD